MTEKPKKRRPKISLRAPSTVYPGQEFTVTVVLNAKAPVDVEWVKVSLTGKQSASIGSGDTRSTKRLKPCNLEAQLCGERRLPKGVTEMKCRMTIPSGLPPSYKSSDARMRYLVAVRVSISWWPDARAEFELQVGLERPRAEYPGHRRLIASADQPEGNRPYMEASLPRDVFAPGEIVSGSVAFGNVESSRYHGLEMRLTGQENVRFPSGRSGKSKRADLRYALPLDPVEGTAYPFRFRLPDAMAPSHETGLWELAYSLTLYGNRRWAPDLRMTIPVTIVPRRFRVATAPERNAPPSVGSERVDRIWAAVAAEHELSYAGEELSGTVDGAALTIAREHRGREGTFMVAELRYPDLALGLSITRGGGWALLGRDAVQIGVAGWDRRHRVDVRDIAQGQSFFAQLAEPLASFRAVIMRDDEARLEAKGAGTQPRHVSDYVARVKRFAETLARARRSLPPPPVMAADVDAWRAVADQLRGTLAHVSMRIDGTHSGMPASIATRWSSDGAPLHTEVQVSPLVPIDDAHQWESAAPIDIDELEGLDRDSRHTLRRVVEGAQFVRIAHDAVTVHLPAPLPDPASVVGRITAMSRLVQELAPSAGPYR